MASIRVLHLLRPHWTLLSLSLMATLVASGAGLLEPWPLKIVLDYVIGGKPGPAWLAPWTADTSTRLTLLTACSAAVIGIAMIGAVASFTEKYLSTTVGKRVGYSLRQILYHHIQQQSLAFYNRQRTGDMVVRLTADIAAAEDFITGAVLGIVFDLVMLLGMLGVMVYLDWRFSVIALSITPVLFVLVSSYMRRIKEATREVKRRDGDLASVFQESIASVHVVKAFAREDFEESRMDLHSLASVDAALRARSIKARLSPIVDVVIAVGTCLVLFFGARFVITGGLSAGALVLFVMYLGKMYKPIKDLSKTVDAVSKAVVAFERIGEILETDRDVADYPHATPARRFEGDIVFDHVAFGYRPDLLVLKDINLRIPARQRVAVVGPTGSGKSTLMALIPRLYDVTKGAVRIDGQDVRSFTLQSLRQQVTIVLQESVLFRASFAENIAYGRPGATTAEIVRVSKLAQAHDFIIRTPAGYDTIVGERGGTLSGGQRQQIAIARALLRDAPILLLDEPSAALDPQSEELIFEGLGTLMEGRTSITIAHRLATVRRADRIFVINGGVIEETGNHEALLAQKGHYARFHRIQFRTDRDQSDSVAV